ncbi:hypothetical protein DRP05_11770 [Archaeoglobales archaeon]|nr:MAG: hypothetical protein DRP05_11770 [Archaeoglobales archaeon]
MKLEFREPGKTYNRGTRTIPAHVIEGVVFIDDEHVLSFELVIVGLSQKKFDINLNLEKHPMSKHVYDFFSNILKNRSETMTGLSEYGRYTSDKCPIYAQWRVKKEVLPEILEEIEKKMNVEWRKAIEKALEYLEY